MGSSNWRDPRSSSSTIGYIVGLIVGLMTIPVVMEFGAIGIFIAIPIAFIVSAMVSGFLKEKFGEDLDKNRKKRKISETELSLVTFIMIAVVGLFFVLPFIIVVEPAIILISIIIVLIIAAVITAELT